MRLAQADPVRTPAIRPRRSDEGDPHRSDGSEALYILQRFGGNRALGEILRAEEQSLADTRALAVQRACCEGCAAGGSCEDQEENEGRETHVASLTRSVQRENDGGQGSAGDAGGSRQGLLVDQLTRLKAAFAPGVTVGLSLEDAAALNAHLTDLSRLPGFGGVRPIEFPAPAEAQAAAAVPLVPVTVPVTAPAAGGAIDAIIAAMLGLTALEFALIAAALLVLIALIIWLFRKAADSGPFPVPAPPTLDKPKEKDPEGKPEDDPNGDPKKPGREPGTVDPIPSGSCRPTGLSEDDPIPLKWFKPVVDDWYPRHLTIGDHVYDRDGQGRLPHGQPIGVSKIFWPAQQKKMQLLPEDRGSAADDFRAVLAQLGFDWSGLQADHVQDLEWSGKDLPSNIWPMDSSANQSAGARNDQQTIGVCMAPPGPYVMYTIREMKAAGLYGRWFRMDEISR